MIGSGCGKAIGPRPLRLTWQTLALLVAALATGCAGIMDTPGEWNAFERWKLDTREIKSASAMGRSKEQVLAANTAAAAGTAKAPALGASGEPLAKGLIAAAQQLEQAGKWHEAAAVYEQARRESPTAYNYTAALGRAFAQAGEPARALAEYQAALAVNPQQPELWLAAGTLHFEQRNYAAAESALRQAVALQPHMRSAWLALGQTLANAGKTAEAYEALAQAMPAAEAHAALGEFFTRAGQPAEAARAFELARSSGWQGAPAPERVGSSQ